MYYDQYGRHVDPYGTHGLGYDDRGHSANDLKKHAGPKFRALALVETATSTRSRLTQCARPQC